MHVPAVWLFLAENDARRRMSLSGEAAKVARHFGFDLREMQDTEVTGAPVKGEGQCRKVFWLAVEIFKISGLSEPPYKPQFSRLLSRHTATRMPDAVR